MIPIYKDNLYDIASFWAFNVKLYLSEPLVGRNRVRYKDTRGINHLFGNRLDKYKFIYSDKVHSVVCIPASQKNKLWERIEDLLKSTEFLIGDRNLCKRYAIWQNLYLKNIKLKNVVKEIFIGIYEDFSSIIAYEIYEKLNIRTCPYCNRHYTFTLDSGSNQFKTRPEFDHFYDKSKYPLLALTFFNLVPSCKECNHGKGTRSCGVNPYFDKFESKLILKKPENQDSDDSTDNIMNINEIFKISKESDFDVDFKMPNDTIARNAENQNIETLGLLPLYNMHKDYVIEIVEKTSAYNELTRNGIIDSFQGVFHSGTDVFNLIFGRYLSDAMHSERPLSKLTSDILDQLEI